MFNDRLLHLVDGGVLLPMHLDQLVHLHVQLVCVAFYELIQ